ncbi:hypothetical protein CFOL_v3_24718 [Cephalotus follicularis]|uniref:Protein SHORTAGE IN CHIASMATA 1 n=1 Tax=Cephalotus follicularis TaxID=3775 RepID=A0A1Q3CLY0_CEPFO|nr:hypothetical protein CFOL_v3_24718 [Cephalotus follicularis]
MPILSGVQGIENNLDTTNLGLTLPYPTTVQEIVYSVEDVTSHLCVTENAYLLEDDGAFQDQTPFHHTTFPLLEVDDISLGTLMSLPMEDIFLSLLGNNELQSWTQKDYLLMYSKEILGSMQYDTLELFSGHCLSRQCLISELACPDIFPEVDFINMVDSQMEGNFAVNQGTSDGDCNFSMNLVTFEEFQFLDVDSSLWCEGFWGKHIAVEPEYCDWMFREDMNFKNFNELIVSHELALIDGTFKSLPIPLISDNENMRSLYVLVEEILAELKPQPLSSSDGIYLDWHVLEEDKCHYICYSSYQNMLEEIRSNNFDFDQESQLDGKFVFDFAFSDDTSYGSNEEKYEESLNIFSDGISLPNGHLTRVLSTKSLNGECPKLGGQEQLDEKHEGSLNSPLDGISTVDGLIMGVASTELLEGGCPKQQNEEKIAEKDAKKASLLFKSLSQFNDLDFFLNPQKAITRDNSESAVKVVDTSATFHKISSHESLAACPATCIESLECDIRLYQEGESDSLQAFDENTTSQKQKEQPKFIPFMDKPTIRPQEAADEAEAHSMSLPVACAPYKSESHQVQQGMSTFPDTVIVVNTQNFDKEMIASRRSTYQRILAMEKEGAQVVERDSELPVDIIISSEICLVWYDCRSIGRKATASDEASSCLPLCVENIATNSLTMLSFTFSACFLVFEGEISFLSTVMESSDQLYAGAASLGIDLQLFCSYSSELTDEIILSCIAYSTKLTRGLYPKMPESESLAESFLTKFPSVNPLTAHAIISSGAMLIEFLEWSHEHRIQAIKKYHVPEESSNLFSDLCRYGEREDSRSIMTDSSSSVSSGPDSDKCHFNVYFEKKHQRYSGSPQKIDIHMDDLFCFEPLNQFYDDIQNTSKVAKPNDSWMSKDPVMFDAFDKSSLSFKDSFGQKQEFDIGVAINASGGFKPYDSWISKGPRILDEIKKPSLPINDQLLSRLGSEMAIPNNVDWHNTNVCKNLQEEFKGEVIDLVDSPSSGHAFSSNANSMHFPPLVPEMGKDSIRKSKTVRRLSFGTHSFPTFPRAAEINSSSSIRDSIKDQRQSMRGTNDYLDADYDNMLPLNNRKRLLQEILTQRSARNAQGLPYQEEISHLSRTPLSNAVHAAHPQSGSPWTIEFLNRIREKSRLRQQSLPCNTSDPCFGYSDNISKVTERKSLSILEYFKYQGGNTPGKVPEQKRLKRAIKSSSSSINEKAPGTLTWTPLDKRATQSLSFAKNENGSQTKLVWSDGSAHGLSKKLRRQ